ncbi:MAG: phosphoglycerate dehydrogenase [Acidobacteriota bacterium]|nr:phosphoglycerate dehydrogenase [Acidobacteriota bacterium]
MPDILISTSSFGQVSSDPLAQLSAAGLEYRLNPYGRRLDPPETVELLAGAAGLIAGTETLSRDILDQASDLRVISRCGSGLENVDLEAAADRGIHIFNTPGAHVDAVAELTLAGILCALRWIPRADSDIRAGRWAKPMGRLLRRRTVGIAGLGRIGKAVVGLLASFEATVLAWDEVVDEDFAARHSVETVSFDDLLRRSEVLSLHVPLNDETRGLIGRAALDAMRPDAVLVNCARGGLVDEQALVESLAGGRLAGAYLDVFESEPYQGPLSELSNAILTPHIGSYAAESRLRMETEAVEHLVDFFRREART